VGNKILKGVTPMTERKSPTMNEWKALYQAAEEFKKVAPWQWLWDADLICVKNPEDGITGYCSIMGRGGEHLALGVYLGDNGIRGFYDMLEGAENIPGHEIVHLQDCIICSFDDREFVEKDDMKIIKELGLKYRGKNEWPVFRRFEPGYYPWYISSEECRFLTVALQQALIIAIGIKKGTVVIDAENGVTVMRSINKDTEEWESSNMELFVPAVSIAPTKIDNDILIKKLSKLQKHRNTAIEVGITYMPTPVRDNEDRPYFPKLFIAADANAGAILKCEVFRNIDDNGATIINKLTEMFMESGLPSSIYLKNDKETAIIGDLCDKIGVNIKVKPTLIVIDELINAMSEDMGM